MEKNVQVGIGVLIFNTKGQLLLGRRLNAHGANTWGPPGGKLDFGESFEGCAQRESFEEAALDLEGEIFEIKGVQNDFFEKDQKHFVSIFMETRLSKDQDPILKEPHKCAGWHWFDMDDLPAPLFSPLEKFFSNDGVF